MRKFINFFWVMAIGAIIFIIVGCDLKPCSGGGSSNQQPAEIYITFLDRGIRTKVFNVKVELLEKGTLRPIRPPIIANNVDEVNFEDKPDRVVQAFARATINSSIKDSDEFEYSNGAVIRRAINL